MHPPLSVAEHISNDISFIIYFILIQEAAANIIKYELLEEILFCGEFDQRFFNKIKV